MGNAHFDTSGFFNNFTSENPSVISRMASLLSNALSLKTDRRILRLPKIIVLILDDNIISTLGEEILANPAGLLNPMKKLLNFIMTEFDRAVSSFKENLPAKCYKNQWRLPIFPLD